MQNKFDVGDIVTFDTDYTEQFYYVISDVMDYSEDDSVDLNNVEYEISLIFPVKSNPESGIVEHSVLKMSSKFGSKNNELMINYVKDMRLKKGFKADSWYLNVFKAIKVNLDNNKFTYKNFTKLMNNESLNTEMKHLYDRMDMLLDRLNASYIDKDKDEEAKCLEEIKYVRGLLVELEYYQFEKRREGTSLIIK